MLRTELAKLVVHGFQADGIELGFETKMSDAADVVAFGISHNLGYQNFSQTPTDINSAAGQALVVAALTGTATDVFVKP